MVLRTVAIFALFGLVYGLVYGFSHSSSPVQVTFFGSGLPTPDASNFEDCDPVAVGKPLDDDCYAYLRADNNDPMECEYTVGFRATDTPVTRLRVKIALMRDGKVLSRDSIQISSLDRPKDDPYITKSVRGDCDAKQLRILEARAYLAGQETDLIATDSIASKSLIPFFSDLFIKIGPASDS